jgi:hypothetical protein
MVVQPGVGKASLYRSQEEAWEAAACLAGPGKKWVVDNYSGPQAQPNPSVAALQAFKLSRLPVLDIGRVMRIPLETAYKAVKPYMPNTRDFSKLGVMVGADTGSGLLRENAKLIKALAKGRGRATQVGLNLVPESSVFKGHGAGNREKTFSWAKIPNVPVRKSTLCAGASDACKSACLQFAGQNTSPTAVNSKHRTTIALLERPFEFARLLLEACKNFVNWHPRKTGLYPYIRLNVLSDIPWEIAFPGLFHEVPGVTRQVHGRKTRHIFYDYTKLVGRGHDTPENYHLTFSFSGTNMAACHRELDAGINATVAFLHVRRDEITGKISPVGRDARQQKVRAGTPREEYKLKLPKVWNGANGLGLPVIDGDKDDLRPLDKQPAWVGLRYKAAAGITDAQLLKKVGAFVVYCWEDTETGLFVAAQTPGQINVDAGK